jgi:hypothetical protein
VFAILAVGAYEAVRAKLAVNAKYENTDDDTYDAVIARLAEGTYDAVTARLAEGTYDAVIARLADGTYDAVIA